MGLSLTHTRTTLRLARPLRISRSVFNTFDVVVVEVSKNGVTGYGEGHPFGRFGESVESASAFLDDAAGLLGDDPFALDEIHRRLAGVPGQMAAKEALDAALHDLCGKLVGLPVYQLLGHPRTGFPTARTVSLDDPDVMARHAAALGGPGCLKLKLGGRDGLDVERVQAVRAATALPLMVDVNEYWEYDEAVATIAALAELGVEYVEQPLSAGDPQGFSLKRSAALPIYLDEECLTLDDLRSCAERGHGVNIKPAKAGGIRGAARMVHAARALGLGVIVGCVIESSLGIAAGCTLAGIADYVDLDGSLLLTGDPWQGVTLTEGVLVPSESPGLGVERRRDRLFGTA